jgi:hypothetical protein
MIVDSSYSFITKIMHVMSTYCLRIPWERRTFFLDSWDQGLLHITYTPFFLSLVCSGELNWLLPGQIAICKAAVQYSHRCLQLCTTATWEQPQQSASGGVYLTYGTCITPVSLYCEVLAARLKAEPCTPTHKGWANKQNSKNLNRLCWSSKELIWCRRIGVDISG